ncbi:hypothetical protein ACRE_012900 [Hapsidospora chrysogenum ATCC 11550]|uniref:Uncharacterized protein n=1 Tax=Hapsidospora chrysogenum (strain ATCC 11550 / CBS 779.69 / DSM 880 / IAM 14645 / JCM 23072 / IMI 49137) TaxID=857340 RepID=A0A086TEF2_HAPC1|nr:hypothetical protein ACRE_012900 [Hapsidospora chrysogenum ATCC 11550]
MPPSLDVLRLETVDPADNDMEPPGSAFTHLLNYLDRVDLGNTRTLSNHTPGDDIIAQLDLTG